MTKLFKLHKLVHLVQHSADSLLSDHLGDGLLSLPGGNAKEISQLSEGDVHVDLGEHLYVMLNKRFAEDRVAISKCDLLVSP